MDKINRSAYLNLNFTKEINVSGATIGFDGNCIRRSEITVTSTAYFNVPWSTSLRYVPLVLIIGTPLMWAIGKLVGFLFVLSLASLGIYKLKKQVDVSKFHEQVFVLSSGYEYKIYVHDVRVFNFFLKFLNKEDPDKSLYLNLHTGDFEIYVDNEESIYRSGNCKEMTLN